MQGNGFTKRRKKDRHLSFVDNPTTEIGFVGHPSGLDILNHSVKLLDIGAATLGRACFKATVFTAAAGAHPAVTGRMPARVLVDIRSILERRSVIGVNVETFQRILATGIESGHESGLEHLVLPLEVSNSVFEVVICWRGVGTTVVRFPGSMGHLRVV